MDRADGNRRMWLLTSTSGQYRPERLAAAVALGILAGLVPKLNLLAVVLYGLILLLPIPSLVSIVVSAVVSVLSFQLDGLAGSLGESLLRQESLRGMWVALEQWPLVPWLGLHNTVVLGNLVLGTVLLAPSYLVSLRLIERLATDRRRKVQRVEDYAPASTGDELLVPTETERHSRSNGVPDRSGVPLATPSESAGERSPLIIPPPKLQRHAPEPTRASSVTEIDEPVLFEPVSDSPPVVSGWHIHRATGAAQGVPAGVNPKEMSETAKAQSRAPQRPASGPALSAPASSSTDDMFFPQMTRAVADRNAALPPAPERLEGTLDSLQVAQSASEVLAWVDDLLDECMAAEGMSYMTGQAEAIADTSYESESRGGGERSSPTDHGQTPRWLIETTIEIVRLTDESLPNSLLTSESALDCQMQMQSESTETPTTEYSKAMPAESMTRAWPKVGGVSTVSGTVSSSNSPLHDHGEPTILNLHQAKSRDQSLNAGFQQLVMAGVGKSTEVRSAASVIEPAKGECLAYLLGHLRQSREGKSS